MDEQMPKLRSLLEDVWKVIDSSHTVVGTDLNTNPSSRNRRRSVFLSGEWGNAIQTSLPERFSVDDTYIISADKVGNAKTSSSNKRMLNDFHKYVHRRVLVDGRWQIRHDPVRAAEWYASEWAKYPTLSHKSHKSAKTAPYRS
ncbi:hypothetical protein Tcan_00079 [Toxocara canis]|uniref:Uncharacterized protein n=1 Tax=Toxocara canis TaxID=6265 RepID=A0A0B2VQX7_TOXCA|nr:hypothetical protein Tcan_00079 [Toxocara canis]